MDEEKPMDLRDKLAIEILNGILSHSKNENNGIISDIVFYVNYDCVGPEADRLKEVHTQKVERVVRACYKVADIMRKVRLSAFE